VLLIGLTVAAAAIAVMIPVFAVTLALMSTVSPTLGLAVGGVAYVLLLGLVLPVPAAASALLHHNQRGRRPRSGPAGPLPGEPS
jgi:cytochrome c biogenesis protein CcdA